MEYLNDREIANKLWSILDDIDTSSDIFKPSDDNIDSYKRFYKYVMSKVPERFKYLASDGYNLFTLEEWRMRNIDSIMSDIERNTPSN